MRATATVPAEPRRNHSAMARPAWVNALLDRASYPHPVSEVQVLETHISWIFLTGDYAYKVKKPVNYGFVDFTTLDKRRHFCEREVALNRRLSPTAYVGVSEVRFDGLRYTMDGPGNTAEYAVKVRQMPRARVLKVLLAQGQVTSDEIRRLARKIAEFHHAAATGPGIERWGSVASLRRKIDENIGQVRQFVGRSLSQDAFDDLQAYFDAFLGARSVIIGRRVAEGRVRDCHGDLHTDQIYLQDGIVFLDCIEFNDAFRYIDAAEDIAFLAMDLDFHKHTEFSRTLIEEYARAAQDPGVWDVLDFFKAYRACVRGKVLSIQLGGQEIAEPSQDVLLADAKAYFDLARSYIPAGPRPALFLMAGLMGAGKTAVGRDLARRWSLDYFSSDVIRKQLAGIAPEEPHPEPYGQGIYSEEFTRRTYEALLQHAAQSLAAGRSVVLDASFHRAERRAQVVLLGRQAGAEVWVIECAAPEAEIRQRLMRRARETPSVSDGRWDLIEEQRRQWQEVEEVSPCRHIRLLTEGTFRETMRRLLRAVYRAALG